MFIYGIQPAANYTTSGTPNTEVANLAMRQVTRGFALIGLYLTGKGAGLTALSGIIARVRHWTTAGSGGTGITPDPRDDRAPAAATVVAGGTPTAGTVDGRYRLSVGCGAAGPGGWVAQRDGAAIRVDAGTADELNMVSASGTASLNYECSAEIEE